MKYKKHLTWVYTISALLLVVGAVMNVFMGIKLSIWIMFVIISLTSSYQGWVIDKLSKVK